MEGAGNEKIKMLIERSNPFEREMYLPQELRLFNLSCCHSRNMERNMQRDTHHLHNGSDLMLTWDKMYFRNNSFPATLCSWPRMFVESYTLTVLSKCTEGSFQTENGQKPLRLDFTFFILCLSGRWRATSGGWDRMDGWMGWSSWVNGLLRALSLQKISN